MKKHYYLLAALLLNLTNTPILEAVEQKQTTPYKLITTTTLCLASSLSKHLASQEAQPNYPITTLQAIQQNGQPHARLLQKIDPHNTYQTQLPLHFHTNWTLEKLQNIPLQYQHHYIHLITNTQHQPQACYIGPAGLQGGGNGQSTSSYNSYDDFEFGYDYARDNSNKAKNTHENTPPATHDDSDHKTYSTPSTPRNNFSSLANLNNDTDDYVSNAISNFVSQDPIESYIQENLTSNTTTYNSPSSSRHYSPSPPSYHNSPKYGYKKTIKTYEKQHNDSIKQIKKALSSHKKSPQFNFSLPKTDFETYARNNSSSSPKTTQFSFSPTKEKSVSPKPTHTSILDTISHEDLYSSTIASKNTTKPLQKIEKEILQNQPPHLSLLQNSSPRPTEDILPKINTPSLENLLKPSNQQSKDLLSLLNTPKEQKIKIHQNTPQDISSVPTQTKSLLDLLNEPPKNPLQPYPLQPSLPDKLPQISLSSTDGKPFNINLNDPDDINQQAEAFAKQYFAQRTNPKQKPPQPEDQEQKQTDNPSELPTLHDTPEKLVSTTKSFLQKITPENKEKYRKEGIEQLKVLEKKRDLFDNQQQINITVPIPNIMAGGGPAAFKSNSRIEISKKVLYKEIKKLRELYRPGNTPDFKPDGSDALQGVQENLAQGGPLQNVIQAASNPTQTLENYKKEWEEDYEVDAIERAKRRHRRFGRQVTNLAAPLEAYAYGKKAYEATKGIYETGKALFKRDALEVVSSAMQPSNISMGNVSKTKQLNKPPLDKTNRLAKNKARGLAAEKRCNIQGPKKSIQVKNKTRVPDSLSNKKIIEIKNVKEQGLTPQLKDYIEYGKKHKNPPILRVRPNTKIQKPLLEEAKKGNIIIKKDIPLTP